ncbi:MAG: hypothetical protein KAR36_02205 [Candidatus Latescibacteria bacterium]|nr:hypothetical protein [Candidatus Latescibacterota bacterium]
MSKALPPPVRKEWLRGGIAHCSLFIARYPSPAIRCGQHIALPEKESDSKCANIPKQKHPVFNFFNTLLNYFNFMGKNSIPDSHFQKEET